MWERVDTEKERASQRQEGKGTYSLKSRTVRKAEHGNVSRETDIRCRQCGTQLDCVLQGSIKEKGGITHSAFVHGWSNMNVCLHACILRAAGCVCVCVCASV